MISRLAWFVCLVAVPCRLAVAAQPSQIATDHFTIIAPLPTNELAGCAGRCETLRAELWQKWFGAQPATPWSPKCLVVVHATAAGYLQAVPGGDRTLGSSWIETESGRIITRRIDVRGDRGDWFAEAFAHELTHVLLADMFVGAAAPRWAEEGLAVLADTDDKQFRHELDFRRAVARGTHFRVVELLSLADYPDARRITAYYGQSANLVRFLVARRTPETFGAFMKQAASHGYDAALRECYDLDGVAELERAWTANLSAEYLATDR